MRMVLWLLAFVPCAAFAADDPETVYGKLHRATLAGSVEEVLSYATAGKRKEMASLAGKEDVVRMMALSLPKAYSVTKKALEGGKAHLEFRGVHDSSGPTFGNAEFVKEKGAWKVDEWSWSALAQATPPKAPAAPQKEPAAEKPPAPVVEITQPIDAPTLRRQTAETTLCVIKLVMSDDDLRRCGANPPKYDN